MHRPVASGFSRSHSRFSVNEKIIPAFDASSFQGVLALTMVSISGALMSKKEVLEPFLALVLGDDLLSWHVSKAPINRTEEQQKAVSMCYLLPSS